jgi:hypothetical protein
MTGLGRRDDDPFSVRKPRRTGIDDAIAGESPRLADSGGQQLQIRRWKTCGEADGPLCVRREGGSAAVAKTHRLGAIRSATAFVAMSKR